MSNNPLKQYFRKPVLYFKLPSGAKMYDSTIINMPPNQELPVYAMTAADEITMRTPDALFNGAAIVDIIKSCVPNILDPWKINSIDIDSVIIAIRAASVGNNLEIESACPKCETNGSYTVNLMTLLLSQLDVDYSKTLTIRDLEIKFRPLEYSEMNKSNLEQFEVQRMLLSMENFEDTPEKQDQMKSTLNKMNEIIIKLITQSIEYIKTPESIVTEKEFIEEFLKNCDKKTFETIKDDSVKLREKNQIKPTTLKCMNCQHEYTQRVILNNSDFFV